MEEVNALKMVADLMAISATTAPKAHGKDFITVKIIEGEEIKKLAEAIVTYGQKIGAKNFDRDGKNTLGSPLVVLIGLKEAKPVGLNCGACGYDKCEMLMAKEGRDFKGPLCAHRLLDLGIALGSAVKTASILNVDNRIMYRVGAVARKIGMIDADIVMGIPLSATGKSIYFDRG